MPHFVTQGDDFQSLVKARRIKDEWLIHVFNNLIKLNKNLLSINKMKYRYVERKLPLP